MHQNPLQMYSMCMQVTFDTCVCVYVCVSPYVPSVSARSAYSEVGNSIFLFAAE